MKLLLIDDNERLVQIYQKILAKEGHETAVETISSNALERIRTEHPDLILLDIMMETLSGWDVLNLIREDSELWDLPVIILTGKIMTVDEALQYGMKIDGFVMKPLERSMLVNAIKEVWEILTECETRYNRAIESGLSEEKAAECKRMIRKRKMLSYLKDVIIRQERLVNLRPEEETDLTLAIDELKKMIGTENQKMSQHEVNCP